MEVRIIENKEEWEQFLSKQDPQIYVQSWYYGEFNKSMGDDFIVIGAYKGDELIGGGVFLQINARRGRFLYAPYCPILDFEKVSELKEFFSFVKQTAKEMGASFIRISPFEEETKQKITNLRKSGFRKSPMHMIAETTWVLTLDQDEVDLLKSMKQNHRNLIRRADRDGVKVKMSTDINDIEKVHKLLSTTAKRHKFVPFSLEYLETEFKTFDKFDAARVFLAYHEEDLLAASIVYYYGNTAVYKHGASNMLKPKIPASYAIQWKAIQEAISKGMKYYNFWGIAPEGDKKHPFYGITHFKKGFGGQQHDLIPAQDLKVSAKYWINFLVETARRIKRGF